VKYVGRGYSPRVEQWLVDCKEMNTLKGAVERTGICCFEDGGGGLKKASVEMRLTSCIQLCWR
jgi:hypothetical protein